MPQSTASYDVIVVGGGAVGALCARDLSLEGRRVLLLDAGRVEGAAWQAAAGMLAPQLEASDNEALHELGVASRDRYGVLADELRDATGVDIGLWREGIGRIATDADEAEALRGRVAWQRQQGQVSDWLDATETRARWPWLRDAAGALWSPMDGALDPAHLVEACRTEALARGAELRAEDATGVLRHGDRVEGVRTGGGEYRADDTIIAAGAWSGRLEGLPRPLSVEPVRGQMAALPWPDDVAPAILYRGDCYVVARNGDAIAGSTMEYAGFDASVTERGQQELWAGVRTLFPPLAAVRPTRTWAGLRPVTPDGLPILGPAPDVTGLWYATGHGRNGILLAAISSALLQQMLRREPVHEHVRALDPARLWHW